MSCLHEECGVFGIYDKNGSCAQSTYYGLYALQHRGQEACGIATINNLELNCYKDVGLVGDVFTPEILKSLDGTAAIGHVRYSTTGGSKRENAQPLTLRYVKGSLAVAHNGNLLDTDRLKQKYEYRGAIFHTSTDSEIIAYIIAQERLKCGSIQRAVVNAMKQIRGAYSVVLLSSRKLIAARDPWGFRPLCIGKRGDAIIFASETCALDSVGATFVRDVEPGEVVYVDVDGKLKSITENCGMVDKTGLCVFEYFYFARPDSMIDGQSVYNARVMAGKLLAEEHPVDADIVIGVPDSGLLAARGYAAASGIPLYDGFVKNRYVARTFIKPEQGSREQAVRIKLNPMRAVVEGKRVVVIDDSIVRGTTSRQTVRLLREAGAVEVHMLSSAPEFIAPCFFGTDIPSKDELMACKYTVDEMCEIIGADSLGFLDTKDIYRIAPDCSRGFCDGCFTEHYPTDDDD